MPSLSRALLVVAVLSSACGLAPPTAPPNARAERAEAELVTACTATMLTNASVCEGPWEYAQQVTPCYAFGEAPGCGVEGMNACFGTCRHPNHGADGAPFTYRYDYPSFQHCQLECSPTTGCRNVCVNICSNDNLAGLRAELDANGWQNATYTVLSGDLCGKNLRIQNYRRATSASCPQAWCPDYRSCRDSSNGLDPDPRACGTRQVHSAPNRTLAQVRAADANIVETSPAPAPRCRTCDSLPIGTAAQVQAKYACLQDSYNELLQEGPSSADAQLATRILREWKLLFELKGNQLTSTQQSHARTLYTVSTAPSLCGSELSPPAVSTSCMNTVGAVWPKLSMCTRMKQDHVPLAVLRLVLNECIDVVASIANVPVSCGRDGWRDLHANLTKALIEKNLGDLPGMTVPNRAAQLTERLKPIARWHDAMPAVLTEKVMVDRTSGMLGKVWKKAVLDEVANLPSTTVTQAHAARMTALIEGLETDRELLLATYLSPPALTGEPLLMLTGDALEGLHARLVTLAAFHDLACRFKPCGTTTAVSQLWNLLAAVHDPVKLDAALAAATLPSVADWRLVFQRIREQHVTLQTALKHAHGVTGGYDPNLVLLRPIDQVAASALGFVRLVRDADARMKTFRAAGTFSTGNPALRIGLERDRQLEIEQAVTSAIAALGSTVNGVQAAEQAQVGVLQQQLRTQGSTVSLQNQVNQQVARLDDLLSDLEGLQVTAAVDEERFGDFMAGFEALAPALEQAQQLQSLTMPPLSVSANTVTFETGSAGPLPDIGVKDLSGATWKVQAVKGELVNFRISGQWSPTCAVQEALITLDEDQTTQTAGALTGPEGFMLAESQGRSVASAVETSRGTLESETTSWSINSCLNFSIGLEEFGSGFSNQVAACLGYEKTRTHIDNEVGSTSNQSNIASTLAFSRGLRSESTPFPDAPVGSLLLVQVPRDATGRADAISVRVLQPTSTVVVTQDADLYLVANEIAGCSNAADAMTVQIDRLVPMSGSEGQRIARLMAEANGQLRQQASVLVGQGRVLPTQLALLRSNVITSLEKSCGCSVNALPPMLMNLFEVFLNKELVHLERQVEMVNLERSLRDAQLQLASASNDFETAGAESRLLDRSAALVLRDLDGRELASQTDLLLEVMRDWVEPVIRLREPQTLTNMVASDLAVLDAVTAVDPTTELVDVADRAQQAAQTVNDRLKAARLSAPAPIERDIAISFVKPGTNPDFHSLWRKADDARSAAVWQQLLSGQNPLLEILPQDLLAPGGGASTLTCANRAPIIKTMAVFFGMPSSVSLPVFDAQATLPSTFSFPTPENLVTLEFANADYLAPTVPLLAGPLQQAVDRAAAYWAAPNRNFATGLSPFTSFALDVQGMNGVFPPPAPGQLHPGHPASIGTELVVVFRVEPKPIGPGVLLPGVPGCD